MSKITLIVLVSMIVSPVHATELTCKGEVLRGSSYTTLGDCMFVTHSPSAARLFKTCDEGRMCEVRVRAHRDEQAAPGEDAEMWVDRLIDVHVR